MKNIEQIEIDNQNLEDCETCGGQCEIEDTMDIKGTVIVCPDCNGTGTQ